MALTKRHVERAAALKRRIDDLQSDIYNLSSELEDMRLTEAMDLADTSGFELQESSIKMGRCHEVLQNLYALKPGARP